MGNMDAGSAGDKEILRHGPRQTDLRTERSGSPFASGAVNLARVLAGACPYTMIAGVLIRWGRLILGFEDARRMVKERTLLSGVTMGRNLALLGLFCPIFWVSLFSGASAATIRFNAIHSGCFVVIGLTWMMVSLIRIEWSKGSGAGCADALSCHKRR